MQIEIVPDGEQPRTEGSPVDRCRGAAAVSARGRFVLAVSGGKNPWVMFGLLAKENLPWDKIAIIQVDERVAPGRR